ncbi:TAXI family TRAP transporter solute-binding subunit [Rhodococcus sp. NPDC058521]|uniref:TAXI family TRAP transporter solute-binding subunit n=1 Tax=Rhodococcus sp. NPDC058521 TaxID=3346536 RepID=UPI003663F116
MIDRRAFLRVAAAGVAGIAVSSCGAPPVSLRLVSGEVGGFFWEFAQLLASAARRANSEVVIAPVATAGSVGNLRALESGEAELGLSLVDSAVDQFTEHGGFGAVGRVYENYMQLAVRDDSQIRRIEDLRGARVSVGAPGSGAQLSAERILAAAGLGTAGAVDRVELPMTEAGHALGNGSIDAALWAGGIPTPSFVGLPVQIRLVDLSATVDQLRVQYGPIYERVVIGANTYGTHPAVATVGLANLLLAANGVSDTAVGAVVDLLIEHASALVPNQAVGSQFLDRQSLIVTGAVPLHPGAAAAYVRQHG